MSPLSHADFTRPTLAFLLLSAGAGLVLAVTTPAQSPARSASSHTEHSSSHRVVVVNGKTVVDEKIVDGKQAPADSGAPPAPSPNADALLRELRARLRAAGADLPALDPVESRAESSSSADASSSDRDRHEAKSSDRARERNGPPSTDRRGHRADGTPHTEIPRDRRSILGGDRDRVPAARSTPPTPQDSARRDPDRRR